MGKKKRGANKLSRMSDEERARYLQHRADIEEENKRRKQQLIAVFMKNKLKREEAFSRLNLAKINQDWRVILRNVKCAELRDELEQLQNFFNDALQRKNQAIERLLGELDAAEEDYATMLGTHRKRIKHLTDLHSERLDFFTAQYEKEKRTMLSQYAEEMDSYKTRKFCVQRELDCVQFGLEDTDEQQRRSVENEHRDDIDRIKSKMILRLETMTNEREAKMNDLWQKLQLFLADYSIQSEEKFNEYVQLRERDNADTEEIKQHYSEIDQATNQIITLKEVLAAEEVDHRIHVNQLEEYKKLLQDEYNRLKEKMENSRKSDREKLKLFVVYSTKAHERLDRLLAMGSTILQLTESCSKYETAKDRENICKEIPNESTQPVRPDDVEEATFELMSKTGSFWTRLNSAQLDCNDLERQKAELQHENVALRDELRKYLAEVAVKNGKIGSNHEKLRPKSVKIDRIPSFDTSVERHRRPATSVEGNMSVAIRSQTLLSNKNKTLNIFSVIN